MRGAASAVWRRALLAAALTASLGAGAFKLGPKLYNQQKLERIANRRVYDEKADANALFAAAKDRASREHKRMLVILGGNWCQWCLALDDLLSQDSEIRGYLEQRFVVLKLDGDAAAELDEAWGRPTRLGVPVLVFLEADGKLAHVQDSASLEVFGGRLLLHDRTRILEVLGKYERS